MKSPVRVAVTGAAGQIAYSLIFRVANGDFLGPDQPVILQLLEIPPAMEPLNGVVMELNDCAFPLVTDIITSDDPKVAFKDIDYGFLVGARPRGPGDPSGGGVLERQPVQARVVPRRDRGVGHGIR